MHKVLHEIETGNWKERAEFRDYNTALQGVNDQDESNNMTTIFFQRFRQMFDKHVAPCWTLSVGILFRQKSVHDGLLTTTS